VKEITSGKILKENSITILIILLLLTPHIGPLFEETIETKTSGESTKEITLSRTDENEEIKKEVTSLSGDSFFINISKEKCLEFGFEHGDIIINDENQIFVVAGVAPALSDAGIGPDVLWLFDPQDNGKVSYWSDEPAKTNLRQEGFKKIEEKDKEKEKKEVFFLI
jgi:hypothetical protein